MNYKRIKNINTLIFDVDGVLTNSQLLITEEGDLLRSMNTRDGYALKKALNAGLNIIIITGGNSLGVKRRLQLLGVKRCYDNVKNKLTLLKSIVEEQLLDPKKILFMGDDCPDKACMQYVGIAACPSDAATEILDVADYISDLKGGHGCVRDVIEKVLQSQNNW